MSHLREALQKEAASRNINRSVRVPLIPGFLDAEESTKGVVTQPGLLGTIKGETPSSDLTQTARLIPRAGAYGAAGIAGAIPGAGLGALFAGKDNRLTGALAGGVVGGITAPLLLALANKGGMFETSARIVS